MRVSDRAPRHAVRSRQPDVGLPLGVISSAECENGYDASISQSVGLESGGSLAGRIDMTKFNESDPTAGRKPSCYSCELILVVRHRWFM